MFEIAVLLLSWKLKPHLSLFSVCLDLSEQMIMEIPIELMLTISKKLPWMFFPDIIPVGHPIFDIINSTDPEVYFLAIIVNMFYLTS